MDRGVSCRASSRSMLHDPAFSCGLAIRGSLSALFDVMDRMDVRDSESPSICCREEPAIATGIIHLERGYQIKV